MSSKMTIVGLSVSALLLTGCGGGSDEPSGSSVAPTDPIDQMLITFQGSPSKTDITTALDNALNATETPITDENYSRAGSVLVTFRKEHGFSEMEILECVPRRTTDPRLPSLSFGNVAAVCITDLVEGNYP